MAIRRGPADWCSRLSHLAVAGGCSGRDASGRCLASLRRSRLVVDSAGAAATFSAWPPALRELVAYLSSGRRFSERPKAS